MSFDKTQVVILSSVEWGAAWQRHHVFATQWASAGHEVFFVENTGFRDVAFGDLPRLWRKTYSLLLGRAARRNSAPPAGLHIVNPVVLPPTRGAFRRLNAFLLVPRLVEQLRRKGLRPAPLVIAYLPTTTTLEALRWLEASAIVYDCVDNFYGLPSPPPDLAQTEGRLLEASDLVVTTSRALYDDKASRHARVLELHQGVAPAFFLDAPPKPAYRRLCYFGTLWSAIDYAPLRALGEAGFEVTLIGPQKDPPPPMPPFVRFKPGLPYEKLPRALGDYDALLLPYVQSEYNRGVVPAKLYECLATGHPVIASPLPSLKPLEKLLYIAETPADWVRIASGLAQSESPAARRQRIERAGEQTHALVFARLREAVRRAWTSPLSRPHAVSEAGGRLSELVRGFTFIGFLYGLAKISTFVTQIAAGRWLGPLEYGKANVVLAAAAYLQVLPIMGFPLAMIKFVASENDELRRSRIIATTLTLFGVWSACWLTVVLLCRSAIAARLTIPPPLLGAAIVFAFSAAFYIVVSSTLLGLRRFDHRGASEAVYGLASPAILAFLVWQGHRSYRAMIAALCASLAAGAAYSLWALRAHLKPALDRQAFRLIFKYASVAMLNLLAMACILAPARLILQRHNSADQVGIFSAYFTSTVQICLAILYILSSVVVPMASHPEGQRDAWRMFKRWSFTLWLAAWAGFTVTAAAGLAVFGRHYPFHLEWAVIFALAAALIMIHGLASAMFAARDFSGLCVSVAGGLTAGAVNIALGLRLIPRWGITGAALALVFGYLAGLLVYAIGRRRLAP